MAYGSYNEYGYMIYLDRDKGRRKPFYEAGNNPLESSSVVPLDQGEPLATIAAYCEQTGKEIAQEEGEQWHGAEYLEID